MNIIEEGNPKAKKLYATRQKLSANEQKVSQTNKAPRSEDEVREGYSQDLTRQLERRPDSVSRVLAYTRAGALTENIVLDTKLLVLILGGVDNLVDRLINVARLSGEWDEGAAITSTERSKQLKELQGERHRLEVAEEEETLRLEDEGYVVFRRENLNVETVLEVWNERDVA